MKLKVILSHIFLKSNLKRATLNCVWRKPQRTDGVTELRANLCSLFPSWPGNPMAWLRKAEPFEGDLWPGGRCEVLFLGHLPVVRPLASGKRYQNANFQKISLVWSNTFRLSTYHLSLGDLALKAVICTYRGREKYKWEYSLSIFHPATTKQSNFKEKALCS